MINKEENAVLFRDDKTTISIQVVPNGVLLVITAFPSGTWAAEFPGYLEDVKSPASGAFRALKKFFGRESRMNELLDCLKLNQILLNQVLTKNLPQKRRKKC